MDIFDVVEQYDFSGKTAIVTGGSGVLCQPMAQALAAQGANVAILSLHAERAQAAAEKINNAGGTAIGIGCNVLEKLALKAAANEVIQKFGCIDILINGAGGNKPQATAFGDRQFFDLPEDALKWVFDLNLMGTIFACQVFGKIMAEQKHGVVLNISSMAAALPLTRVVAYSAAKAGLNNFTQWLAVHMAQEYSPNIRVNAIAPGFYVAEQNRALLIDPETGDLTPRGQTIISQTPMNRFGEPEDLLGATLWLVSPASRFVTGIIIPVDGGFSAFSGV